MITMFIRTEDQFSGDWFKDLGRMHRGHVVEVLDGVVTGGTRDRERTDLKIIHLDMLLSEAVAFTTAEPGDVLADFTLRRLRMFRIDLDVLPVNLRNGILDTSRATTVDRMDSVDAIRAAKVEIPKLVNPDIIGTEAENLFTVG